MAATALQCVAVLLRRGGRGGGRHCIWGGAALWRAAPPNTEPPGGLEGRNDARTGMPARVLAGAMCVQRFDGSLNSAIHITYRISLRSSSMPEPRDPLLKVLIRFLGGTQRTTRPPRRAGGLQEFGCVLRRAPGGLWGPPGGTAEATAGYGSQWVLGVGATR